jgi:dienelactone hydrolase
VRRQRCRASSAGRVRLHLNHDKEQGIEPFARAFAEAGFVVLLHDHRNFGASDGAIRHDVDPWRQIADWRRAISFLESQPEVDATRIGIWGTSYAGGHVIVLGATDRRIRAVASQVPTISGFEQGLRRIPADAIAGLENAFSEDERAQLRGAPLRRQLIVSADPSVPALYHSKGRNRLLPATDRAGHMGEHRDVAVHAGRAYVRTRHLGSSRVSHAAPHGRSPQRHDYHDRSGARCL